MLKAANVLATFQNGGTIAENTVTLNCSTTTVLRHRQPLLLKPALRPGLARSNHRVGDACKLQPIGLLDNSSGGTDAGGGGVINYGPHPYVHCDAGGRSTCRLPGFEFDHFSDSRVRSHHRNGLSAQQQQQPNGRRHGCSCDATVNGGSAVASALTTSVATVNLTCQKVGSLYYPDRHRPSPWVPARRVEHPSVWTAAHPQLLS